MANEKIFPDPATTRVIGHEDSGLADTVGDAPDDELHYTFDVDGNYIGETIDLWMRDSFPQILQAATVSASQLPELVGRTKESAGTPPGGLSERTGRAELNRQENLDILRRCAPNCIVTELQPNIQDGLGARYQIEYQLCGHPVVAVVEELPQAGFIETSFSRKHFAVLHWLISRTESADTEYVDAVKLSPKVASTALSVSIKQIDSNPANYYNEQKKMIVISSLSFRGLGVFGHENGHAWHNRLLPGLAESRVASGKMLSIFFASMESEKKAICQSDAQGVSRHDNPSHYIEDLLYTAHSERFATSLAKKTNQVFQLLPPDDLLRYLDDLLEKCAQTYDQALSPFGATSELARSIPIETASINWNYTNWLIDTRNRIDELTGRISGGVQLKYVLDDKTASILITDDLLSITFQSPPETDPPEKLYMRYKFNEAFCTDRARWEEVFNVSLRSLSDIAAYGMELDSTDFLRSQKIVEDLLADLEQKRDQSAREALTTLIGSTSADFITQFDPRAILLASHNLPTADKIAFDREHPQLLQDAFEPSKRLTAIANALSRYLLNFFKPRLDLVLIDKYRDERISSAHGLLIATCRIIAVEQMMVTADEVKDVSLSSLLTRFYTRLSSSPTSISPP